MVSQMIMPIQTNSMQGSAVRLAYKAHNLEAVGSNPTPATNKIDNKEWYGAVIMTRSWIVED